MINITLQNNETEDKEYQVFALNKVDADERIEACLNNDNRIKTWKILEQKIIDVSEGVSEEQKHMLGVWSLPIRGTDENRH